MIPQELLLISGVVTQTPHMVEKKEIEKIKIRYYKEVIDHLTEDDTKKEILNDDGILETGFMRFRKLSVTKEDGHGKWQSRVNTELRYLGRFKKLFNESFKLLLSLSEILRVAYFREIWRICDLLITKDGRDPGTAASVMPGAANGLESGNLNLSFLIFITFMQILVFTQKFWFTI